MDGTSKYRLELWKLCFSFSFSFLFRKRGVGLFFCPAVEFLICKESRIALPTERPREERSRQAEIKQRQTEREGWRGTENKEGMEKLRGIEWTGQRQGRQSKRAGRFRMLG